MTAHEPTTTQAGPSSGWRRWRRGHPENHAAVTSPFDGYR
jgi:hypothetical protein